MKDRLVNWRTAIDEARATYTDMDESELGEMCKDVLPSLTGVPYERADVLHTQFHEWQRRRGQTLLPVSEIVARLAQDGIIRVGAYYFGIRQKTLVA